MQPKAPENSEVERFHYVIFQLLTSSTQLLSLLALCSASYTSTHTLIVTHCGPAKPITSKFGLHCLMSTLMLDTHWNPREICQNKNRIWPLGKLCNSTAWAGAHCMGPATARLSYAEGTESDPQGFDIFLLACREVLVLSCGCKEVLARSSIRPLPLLRTGNSWSLLWPVGAQYHLSMCSCRTPLTREPARHFSWEGQQLQRWLHTTAIWELEWFAAFPISNPDWGP